MAQPNILLVHADQHRFDCVSATGHPLLQTPSLDRLAREGVCFTHAFCPIPLCTPSRTSLLTGLWPTQHGCIANRGTEAYGVLAEGTATFSQALREHGYSLGYVGKWEVATNQGPTAFGFDEYLADHGYLSWRKEQGLPPLPTSNGWFGEVDAGVAPEQSGLAWGATQVIRLLDKAAHQGRPFFLRWDPREPHLPNVAPEPFASMYSPEQIPPWPSFPDPLDGKPFIQKQQLRTWAVEGWGWERWAPVVARYLGVITLLDQQVGRILTALDELSLSENTFVVYTSDHGDLCGGHGMVDKHFVMYDDVVRVPLVLRWPAKVPAGQVCDAFVCSAIDLASTFCDAAGVAPPVSFMGHSLLPLVRGEGAWDRQDIFATYHGNQFGLYSQRMVRDRRWKYVWNATAEDELYDLEDDPGEITNLVGNPECTRELSRLRSRLVEWMEQTQDRLLNPWTRQQLMGSRKS